jgi:hypothetical protein
MNPEVHAVAVMPATVIPSKIHVGPSRAHQASEERLNYQYENDV